MALSEALEQRSGREVEIGLSPLRNGHGDRSLRHSARPESGVTRVRRLIERKFNSCLSRFFKKCLSFQVFIWGGALSGATYQTIIDMAGRGLALMKHRQ